MKFLLLLAVLAAFVASSLGLKNAVCKLPHSKNGFGNLSCAAYDPSWSYNQEKNQCVFFAYGGCGGNANRFHSQAECEEKCKE